MGFCNSPISLHSETNIAFRELGQLSSSDPLNETSSVDRTQLNWRNNFPPFCIHIEYISDLLIFEVVNSAEYHWKIIVKCVRYETSFVSLFVLYLLYVRVCWFSRPISSHNSLLLLGLDTLAPWQLSSLFSVRLRRLRAFFPFDEPPECEFRHRLQPSLKKNFLKFTERLVAAVLCM